LAAALAVGARGRPGAKLHGAALNADLVENPCDSSHHLGMCGVEVGAQFARRVCMPGDLVEVDADAVQFVIAPRTIRGAGRSDIAIALADSAW